MGRPPRQVAPPAPSTPLTTTRARIVAAASAAALVALAVAWVLWPTQDPRSDLEAVASVPTTHSSTTTTTSTPTVPMETATTPPETSAPPPPTTTVPPVAEPTRLRIPSLGVDAAVVPVGLALDGQMEIPAASDVGWYRLGPRPGDPGSAVLAAHVDFGGRPGAFYDLGAIPVGAEVVVDTTAGSRRYVVTVREQVAKADVELARYFTGEGPARLTLITCGGAFSRSAGHYQDNLLITAAPLG